MKWISNAPARKNPEEGTIYRLDATMVSINHYAGLGEKWFLTYKPLNFQCMILELMILEWQKRNRIYISRRYLKSSRRQ